MKADKRRARFGGRNGGPGWWHVWQYQRPLALKAGRHDARPAITVLADVWTPETDR